MSECVEWAGCRSAAGYGVLRKAGRNVLAHRDAYANHHGLDVFTMGGVIRHGCDNPACVNPDHLSLGTQAQNMRDAADRKRVRSAERHPHAVLTWEQVHWVRHHYIPRHRLYGCRGMARRFGCSHTIISDVVLGRAWVTETEAL